MGSSRTRRRVAAVALGAVVAGGLAYGTTTALFTDQEVLNNNTFSAATLDLTATAPSATSFTLASMVPGDVVTAPITVGDAAGSADLRYAMTSATTGDATLAAALKVTVKTGLTGATCTSAGFSGGTAIASAVPLGPSTAVFGSATTGAQAGDRNLAGGASEVLCVQVALPLTETNTIGGKSTTATFTFTAEQTRNN
jgi:predicted ribosomally synthesized peptide with SipW-like signal peptide